MKEQELQQRAQELFAESVDGLDGQTLSRLNQGRQQALESAAKRPAFWRYGPLGGLLAASVVAVFMLQSPTVTPVSPTESASDFEILLSEDSLEMLEELEFFAWMATQETTSDDTNG